MEFRTVVEIPEPAFQIAPCEEMLLVGSCFADRMGSRFKDEQFRVTVNPYGVMYNPVSVCHTVQRVLQENQTFRPTTAMMTLGTNHVYVEKETGEVVDNCRKRPQYLFEERELTVDECADWLKKAIILLRDVQPDIRIVITVSPIRYAKYGFHGSQLSKATLLLAVHQTLTELKDTNTWGRVCVEYFPAYELILDELRDYRFYAADMLHLSDQAVEYVYERFAEKYFTADTKQFLKEWGTIKKVLDHRPFNPDSEEYRALIDKTMEKVAALTKKYPTFVFDYQSWQCL